MPQIPASPTPGAVPAPHEKNRSWPGGVQPALHPSPGPSPTARRAQPTPDPVPQAGGQCGAEHLSEVGPPPPPRTRGHGLPAPPAPRTCPRLQSRSRSRSRFRLQPRSPHGRCPHRASQGSRGAGRSRAPTAPVTWCWERPAAQLRGDARPGRGRGERGGRRQEREKKEDEERAEPGAQLPHGPSAAAAAAAAAAAPVAARRAPPRPAPLKRAAPGEAAAAQVPPRPAPESSSGPSVTPLGPSVLPCCRPGASSPLCCSSSNPARPARHRPGIPRSTRVFPISPCVFPCASGTSGRPRAPHYLRDNPTFRCPAGSPVPVTVPYRG